jgi:hypothetical protein
MDVNITVALIGVASGAAGYWITTFYMEPIMRYYDVRNQILMDFIYYAQATNANDMNEEMQKLYRERILSNRKSSAQLSAAVQDLPFLYLSYLKIFKGLNPEAAVKKLIGFSNTTEYDESLRLQDEIRRHLGLPSQT